MGTRTHLVWDWNGTLLNDLQLVVAATNAAFASVAGPAVTPDEHRRRFRRPISEYYAQVLDRAVDSDEFGVLDRVFHDAYRDGLTSVTLAADAAEAMREWGPHQSLLSMWFHSELVPVVERYGLSSHFLRVDGLPHEVGGGLKSAYLVSHLDALGVDGADVVLIGDSLDDADAAHSVGGAAVLYTGGFTDPDRLRASGLPVADTLTDAVRIAQKL